MVNYANLMLLQPSTLCLDDVWMNSKAATKIPITQCTVYRYLFDDDDDDTHATPLQAITTSYGYTFSVAVNYT
jgi:hypothetical protein